MSRTLTRLRSVTGDPLLVRAERGLVPTPHAAELRERVHALSGDVLAFLRMNALQQQARFDEFIQEFKEERPHEALGMKRPADFYSPRPGPTTACPPSHTPSTTAMS